MSDSVGNSVSRFRLESHAKNGTYIATLPYRNAQGEWQLGANGAQLRIEIPYRNYSQVNRNNLWEAKHELWLYDSLVSNTDPIFAGPVWDITASSSSGVLSCSAQDALSYLSKRYLKTSKTYTTHTAPYDIQDLVNTTISASPLNMVVSVSGTTTSFTIRYKAIDRNKITDLIDSLAQMYEGTDYYMRTKNGVHTLFLVGGRIKSLSVGNVLEYGGQLEGYSVQYNAQTIANDYDVVSENGRIGNATSSAKKTEYGNLYSQVDSGSTLTSTTDLNASAATLIKDTQSSKTIPTLVTRKLTPIKDFDFGSQFGVVVNDGYVNINQTIRVVGWQLTIGQGDLITTNIYTKDTEGVS